MMLALNRQRGAVMLETAYVLPIMLGVILFVVEAVAYAMNSFAANDVLTDVHSAILVEVSEVSNLAAGATPDPSIKYVECGSTGKVALKSTAGAELTTFIKQSLETKGVTFDASQPIAATVTNSTISGFEVYVINFKATANSLVLPSVLEAMLPMSVDTIISIKDSCH
ncbi:hypothetical protein [Thiomicrorhabdus sp.]|uniref:hypothetical protein n=1 Tax=Thiomicrorhabdus sp. TaxID=2039724 RepID=UPI0035694511